MKPQFVGWIGIFFILAAFTLVTFGLLAPSHIVYGLLNLIGASSLIVSSYEKRDFPPIALNAVWIVVAIIGIVRSMMVG